MKKTILLLAAVGVLAVAGIFGVFTVFVKLAETEFVLGNDTYIRDVYVVLDQTLSMGTGQRHEAKDIVMNEILNVAGLGDRLFCYRIASNFQESQDRVFRSSRYLPKVPENVPGTELDKLTDDVRSMLVARWQDFQVEKADWINKLETVSPPRGNWSDYLGTVSEISRRMKQSEAGTAASERWLVLVGDLKHEPVPEEPPPITAQERNSFSNVNIYLVYPAGVHSDDEQRRIEAFWRSYFTARGNRKLNFMSFDGFVGRFPENVVASERELLVRGE